MAGLVIVVLRRDATGRFFLVCLVTENKKRENIFQASWALGGEGGGGGEVYPCPCEAEGRGREGYPRRSEGVTPVLAREEAYPCPDWGRER